MVKKIFFVLFIMLIGVSIFAFYGFQKQKLPRDVLKLEIIGPSEVEMLEDVEYTIKAFSEIKEKLEAGEYSSEKIATLA